MIKLANVDNQVILIFVLTVEFVQNSILAIAMLYSEAPFDRTPTAQQPYCSLH